MSIDEKFLIGLYKNKRQPEMQMDSDGKILWKTRGVIMLINRLSEYKDYQNIFQLLKSNLTTILLSRLVIIRE